MCIRRQSLSGSVLAGVHAKVGCDAQRFGIRCVVRKDSDADAGADPHRFSVEGERLVEKFRESFPTRAGVGAGHGLFKNHGELIAAGARHGVGLADAAGEEIADVLEQFVAGVMACGVVHQLEVVQVDQKQSDMRSGAARALDGADQSILKEAAVGQAGQFVMQGQVFVVLELILKKKHDHAHCDDVLGQIPDFAFEMEVGKVIGDARSGNEDASPGKEAGDGDEGSRGCAPVGVPEMDGAAKINGEEHRLEGKRSGPCRADAGRSTGKSRGQG